MDISNTRLKELLDKYLEGTATEEEIRVVDDWYQSFGSHPGLSQQLSPDQRAALEQLLFWRISRQAGLEQRVIKVMRPWFRSWWAAAGIVLLLGAAGLYVIRPQIVKPRAEVVMVTEQADRGNIKKIALPDGSIIWLNFDSKLRYAQDNDREIWLEGEGYFEVAPRADKQFVVHSGKLDVQVLGTSFNIEAYTPVESVTVTVASGKVAVSHEKEAAITLTANQQAVYQGGRLEKHETAVTDISAWTQGMLVFKNARFRDIAPKLERRFNVRIRFDGDRTGNALLTGSFNREQSLNEILRMLCDICGFSYRQEKSSKEYLIYDDQPHQ